MTISGGVQAMGAGMDGMDKDAAQHRKLVDAAQQFEGMLLQEMLKGMQSGKDELGSGDGSGDSSGDDSGDTLRSFGTEAVARAIAKGGGVGIARQVVRKVEIEHAQSTEKKMISN
jgi:peptidoglycan hydrolase FlgJ